MDEYRYTQEDFAILDSYRTISKSIGSYLGENAELILYSFENKQHSIIHIVNGHLSNKKIGDYLSERDRSVLNELLDKNNDYKNNFVENVTGEYSKINYTLIKNSNKIPIGLMMINWNYDISLINTLKIFIPEHATSNSKIKENKNSKSEDIILDAIKKVITGIDKDEVGPSVYNKTIIRKLFNQGIFEFKESVQIVANYLNISHHTVYLHLRSIKKIKKSSSINKI